MVQPAHRWEKVDCGQRGMEKRRGGKRGAREKGKKGAKKRGVEEFIERGSKRAKGRGMESENS